ncbi:MAG: response regulator [Pseudomonadota bacterium]
MSNSTILIVDDDEKIIKLLKHTLVINGYSVLIAFSGEQAIKLSEHALPDLVVLELMLPGIDGLAVTRHLKNNQHTSNIPIIMLTAKHEDSDIIDGFESGANDYMSKPFSPKELVARIESILRRQRKKTPYIPDRFHQEKELIIDRAKHRVNLEGEQINLTLTEFELLSTLGGKKGWVFTRGQIVDALHGDGRPVATRSVDVVVAGLRKKLKHYADIIETVRGVGYRFKE